MRTDATESFVRLFSKFIEPPVDKRIYSPLLCSTLCNAETIAQILNAVRTYEEFYEDIDPYSEHDMGRFTVCGEDYYWWINYYDRNLELHSPDPADTSATIRVLTTMRVDEY